MQGAETEVSEHHGRVQRQSRMAGAESETQGMGKAGPDHTVPCLSIEDFGLFLLTRGSH